MQKTGQGGNNSRTEQNPLKQNMLVGLRVIKMQTENKKINFKAICEEHYGRKNPDFQESKYTKES